MIAGDAATVTVLVRVPPAECFRLFTEEVDLWWRKGLAFRPSGRKPGIMCFEPRVGGRMFESVEGGRVFEMGTVTEWAPPRRLAFEWRGVNFAPGEKTLVEVSFAQSESGTQVTVRHSGFASLREDHPVRHGQAVVPFIGGISRWWGDLMTSLREHAAPTSE
jgi:uncharacterized protein YndB with AHSA1/START domain